MIGRGSNADTAEAEAGMKMKHRLSDFEFAANTKKMPFCYSRLSRTASDSVDEANSTIPKDFKFLDRYIRNGRNYIHY